MDAAHAWRVLGLAPGASPDAVRTAFRVAAQILHPDRVRDLGADVQAEAARRMAELSEAYRLCAAMSRGLPPPRTRARTADAGPLPSAGPRAAEMLAEARAALARVAPLEAYLRNRPTVLDRDENAAASRRVVRLLEHVADAWPGTAEGDAARVLLVTSAAARNTLSARERAGHLVLVAEVGARDTAWDGFSGRDQLTAAQVVYAHPTAAADLRRRARTRLVELGDWATVAADEDEDIRRAAAIQTLLLEARGLGERAPWLSRRERPGFESEVAEWRRRAAEVVTGLADAGLRDDLRRAETALRDALVRS